MRKETNIRFLCETVTHAGGLILFLADRADFPDKNTVFQKALEKSYHFLSARSL